MHTENKDKSQQVVKGYRVWKYNLFFVFKMCGMQYLTTISLLQKFVIVCRLLKLKYRITSSAYKDIMYYSFFRCISPIPVWFLISIAWIPGASIKYRIITIAMCLISDSSWKALSENKSWKTHWLNITTFFGKSSDAIAVPLALKF